MTPDTRHPAVVVSLSFLPKDVNYNSTPWHNITRSDQKYMNLCDGEVLTISCQQNGVVIH